MMNMKKFVMILMLLALVITVPVSAADRKLTIERAVQISDTQIVIEFSEPIAININQSNNGPYVALRIGENGYPTYVPEKNTHLQWRGIIEFVDENRDRVLWTLADKAFGVTNINDIRNCTGELAEYKDKPMWLTVEEIPYNVELAYTDNTVCNITTLDGEVYLTPTFPIGWESCNVELEKDYRYDIDYDKVIDVDAVDIKDPVLFGGDEIEIKEEVKAPSATQTETVVKNDPIMVALRLGLGAAIGAGLLVIGVILRKKRTADAK
jgi:hypothetical protein